MSAQTYLWIKALHQGGMALWIGSMVAVALTLGAHQRADAGAKSALAGLVGSLRRVLEIGAGLAIVAGVVMIVDAPIVMKQPYFHIKLTLVVGVLALHGYLSMKSAKVKRGSDVTVPAWLTPLIVILALAIIWVIVVKPLVRA